MLDFELERLPFVFEGDWAKPPPSSNPSNVPQIPTPAQAALLDCEESKNYLRSFPFKVYFGPDGSPCIEVQCTVASCGAVFSCKKAFRSHLRIHTAAIRPACPFESKGFKCKRVVSSGWRIRHMMTHFPTLEQCSHCHRVFNRKCALEFHIRAKHQGDMATIAVEST